MRSFLGASVILSSIALLIGCVWFTHRQANPVMLPGSKSISHLIPPADRQKAAQAVMPGSKSAALIMPGSKSFTGATTISAGVLQSGKPTLKLMPSSKLGIFRMDLSAPSQKP
jgi:autotransporter-associated beta strand protein